MAIVKVKWVDKGRQNQSYLTKDRDSETIESRESVGGGDLVSEFESIHEQHGSRAKHLALQIIQSWHPSESKLLEPQKYNDMGLELAKRMFPDHQAQVVTHQDRGHIHNHIIVNTVNSLTGKLIENKKALLYKLRDASDVICKENGLSVLTPTLRSQEAKLPSHARDMATHGKRPILLDIMQKADFARSASTSFDEYSVILRELGVHARVENKNITYFYGDSDERIRGKRLGSKYGKDGLIEAFKENDGKFNKSPELRSRIRGEIGAIHDGKGNIVGAASDLLLESAGHTRFGEKDYGRFTKVDRSRSRSDMHSNSNYGGVLPIEEVAKAAGKSIFDYCERNNIALTTDKNGRKVIKGREHVVLLSDTSWKNSRNGSEGTLIDFVSNHHQESILRAVSRINNNPRLLLLESVSGDVKKTYASFYIPKQDQLERNGSLEHLKHFSKHSGVSETALQDLYELKKLQVSRNGSVWMFAGENDTHAVEHYQDQGSFKSEVTVSCKGPTRFAKVKVSEL